MKKILIIIFALILLAILILLLINFTGTALYDNKIIGQAEISGKTDSEFMAETVSNGKTIEYIFTPKTEEKNNYLLSYKLKKDGEVIDIKNKELLTGVSKDNPISFGIIRDNKSEYSLETIIYDAENSAHELHNDRIVIQAQQKQSLENNEKIKELFSDYIKKNINSLSQDEAVLGGSFYVTKIRFLNENSAFVNYEDGHIALSALVHFYLNDNEIGITSFQIKEDGVSFSEIGNIVSSEDGWDVVYEKPGEPALRETLIFTNESKCLDDGAESVCNSSYWENGDRIKISGKLKFSGVEVATLGMVNENSQVDSHADDGVEDVCVDSCGNDICEEVVCFGEGCSCAETLESCPSDCK